MKMHEKIHVLSELYNVYYNTLYNNPQAFESDAPELVQSACAANKDFQKVFKAFEKSRCDLVVSDREYAAYMLAYHEAEKCWKEIEMKERAMQRKRRLFRKKYGSFLGDVLYLNELGAV